MLHAHFGCLRCLFVRVWNGYFAIRLIQSRSKSMHPAFISLFFWPGSPRFRIPLFPIWLFPQADLLPLLQEPYSFIYFFSSWAWSQIINLPISNVLSQTFFWYRFLFSWFFFLPSFSPSLVGGSFERWPVADTADKRTSSLLKPMKQSIEDFSVSPSAITTTAKRERKRVTKKNIKN